MTGELLTDAEHRAMALTVELWNLLAGEIVGSGPSRAGDLRELCADLHAIQLRIMAQAAGRAYPDRYRLMGGMVGDGLHEEDEPVAGVQVPPTVGPPAESGATCTYSPRLGDPVCGQPASLHVVTESAQYGIVGLVTCPRHAGIARGAGGMVAEHPFTPSCGRQDAPWKESENTCGEEVRTDA
jgi:hypothetical protein